MMKIDALRVLPRSGNVMMLLSDGSAHRFPKQVAADCALYEGRELTDGELEQILQTGKEASAKARAVRIVAASGVSERELEKRLIRKGEDEACARQAVDWLKDLNLLDDRETAFQLVRSAAARGYGKARIKSILYEKGIPRDYWDEALAELGQTDDAIDAFLQKRFAGIEPDEQQVKKATDALLRRGFGWGEIRDALRRFRCDAEFPDIDETLEDME